MARNRIATKNPVLRDGVPVGVSIDFADGRNITLMFADVAEAVVPWALQNGFSQKLGDSYAGLQGDEAYAECEAVRDALLSGDWNRRGDGTGGVYLPMALAELAKVTLEEAKAKLAELSSEERKAISGRKDVKAVIARLKADAAMKRAEAEEGEDIGELFA